MSFTLQLLDGQLGLTPPSNAGAAISMGICSDGLPNTLYTAGNSTAAASQLGQGPLPEVLVDRLNVAGGPGYAIPLNPSTLGSAGSTTYAGTGTGTVVADEAPHKQILLKIEVGGAPGASAMTFRYSVGGAAYSAPIPTTSGAFTYLVPGTLTKVTFANQTYTAADVWTITTAGAVSVAGSGTAGWVTYAASPLDIYDIRVTIKTSGALGVAVFYYSLDGGNTRSDDIMVPSGGVYVLANTGVFLTFAGTFTAHASPYTIATTTAAFTTSDVNSAMTVALASAVDWEFVHVTGMATDATGAATMAATLSVHMTTAETNYRYVFAVMECPTNGIADSVVAAAFTSFVDKSVVVCAGDIGHTSSVTPGRVFRRNCGVAVASKISAVTPGTSIAWAGKPFQTLKNVKSLYRDEAVTPLLGTNRFVVLTTEQGEIGYRIFRGNTMAAPGSDYGQLYGLRVINVARRVARKLFLTYQEQKIPVNKPGMQNPGKINAKWAAEEEANAAQVMRDALHCDASVEEADAIDARMAIDRTENILSTKTFRVAVSVTPFGYAQAVIVTVGFENPALA